jgi:hypothetical protein
VATLEMSYSDSTAVIGPLALQPEPGTYDLCLEHATNLTVPNGWEVVRLPGELDSPQVSEPNLAHLTDAIRAAGFSYLDELPARPLPESAALSRRRRHLAIVAD